jgi:hypothetical protein
MLRALGKERIDARFLQQLPERMTPEAIAHMR